MAARACRSRPGSSSTRPRPRLPPSTFESGGNLSVPNRKNMRPRLRTRAESGLAARIVPVRRPCVSVQCKWSGDDLARPAPPLVSTGIDGIDGYWCVLMVWMVCRPDAGERKMSGEAFALNCAAQYPPPAQVRRRSRSPHRRPTRKRHHRPTSACQSSPPSGHDDYEAPPSPLPPTKALLFQRYPANSGSLCLLSRWHAAVSGHANPRSRNP